MRRECLIIREAENGVLLWEPPETIRCLLAPNRVIPDWVDMSRCAERMIDDAPDGFFFRSVDPSEVPVRRNTVV